MSSEQRMNSLRIALATLTGETSRDQLEETLTACRFHRLVHGVDEPQQNPFLMSSYTLLRHPSLNLKHQQQHSKGVMINPKLLSTHQAVYVGLAVSDRGPDGSSIGQNASASTDRGPAGSSIGQNASASTDRGPAGSSIGQNASASTESPVVALLPSSPAEAESLITQVSTENMNDGYALPLGDYNASLQNSRQTKAEKSTHHDEYDSCCGICLDHGDLVIIEKCSHALCVDCALELLKVHPSDLVPCPFCRGPIQGFRI
ncbi:hypothetical protein CEUSTIGMA_g4729.t1 [Chlamydomonas eustigma]|uniref:RING-type domain-containing protein n=1 Tax=Chlamydomonas eustigma TaxID=1157962 RepID=A0A250X2G7_9CHLO|nr:hypothetical protein CEUSTIGMA_g4729.t1 [Chlamydomonas eustigma]|eukprot:GAX77283.1 hypothetical protein CEUSTIGMA_g4729.t1 [Chlamydomonas eustigma]